ncbi:siroheme synthase CysG [Chachezhania antarctica]|uniref:siroheme synthase CysG n=1 Tax=Chachezhania antarctica TaxID=2340860 RepID=UPI000EACB5F9|nr:siroheme synthase CysG [Chachezhania antarctica]
MQHFPIFLATTGARVVLSGGGPAALAKLRLLMKTEARIDVYAPDPAPEIEGWAEDGALHLHRRALAEADIAGATLVYAADEDEAIDADTARWAKAAGILCNVVDNLAASAFITPAMVDRDPVCVAIGTEGAAPVLARRIKADLESRLPATLGRLARAGKKFRGKADELPHGRIRRAFWDRFYSTDGPRAFDRAGDDGLEPALQDLFAEYSYKAATPQAPKPGHVTFVGAGPGDPELLTLKARRALHEADVVIHDRLVTPAILELARREATILDMGKEAFGPSTPQAEIDMAIAAHARTGAHVVRLKSGDATIFGRLDEEIAACEAAGVDWSIVPGITSASAAVATIGQSLTQRGRNGSVTFLTGHDVKGFADQDWAKLAAPGSVAAIYMGKAAARFLQGRLMMHGAAGTTPVTVVENASRPEEKILGTTLGALPQTLSDAGLDGPALILFGLAPRRAAAALTDLEKELA